MEKNLHFILHNSVKKIIENWLNDKNFYCLRIKIVIVP